MLRLRCLLFTKSSLLLQSTLNIEIGTGRMKGLTTCQANARSTST